MTAGVSEQPTDWKAAMVLFYLPKSCAVCGEVFMPTGSRATYCSPRCRYAADKIRKRAKRDADPAWNQHVLERNRASRHRRAQDPEWRAQRAAVDRARRAAKKAATEGVES